jgi:hypothetical protein
MTLVGVIVAVLMTVTAAGCARHAATASSGAEVPSRGTPTPATCPATLDLAKWPGKQTRTGPFLPAQAAEALLCRYPLSTAENGVAQFVGPPLTTDKPTAPAAYLNSIPDQALPTSNACLSASTDSYVLVFGYPDRPAAVVHLACGAEQSGAVRYDYDIRVIFSFWGLSKTGKVASPTGVPRTTS